MATQRFTLMIQEKHPEEANGTIEIIVEVEQDFSLADYLPEDHSMNDPNCTCDACTYPLS